MGHRKPKEAVETKPQRYCWKTIATYPDHGAALADKAQQERAGKLVKIKHRGDRFEVRVGTPVKQKTEAPIEPIEPEVLDS